MTEQRKWQFKPLTKAVAAVALSTAAPGVLALSFEFGEGGEVTMDLDTTVNYSAQWRISKPDDHKIQVNDNDDVEAASLKINADDGNYNFNRSLIKNKISAITEMDLKWRNFGFFGRGRAYWDDVYDSRTDHDEEEFLTYNSGTAVGGDTEFRQFPDETIEEHRDRIEMLDYYLYASGDLPGDRLFDLRLGSQAINWGTSTFFQGISALQNPIDVVAANNPGVEQRELLLPTGAFYAQVDLLTNLTLETYYQYEWSKTELNGVGSFFSTQDFLGPGARNFLAAGVSARKVEGEADDEGQWGAAVHWFTEGGSDIGFYYVNAHSKTPAFLPPVVGTGSIDTYAIEYYEDIQGYAASFSTVLGITNIQGEVSYQTDVAVVTASGVPEEGDVIITVLGGSHVFEPTAYWDDLNLVFDVALAHVDSHDSSELRFDDTAYAASVRAEINYLNVYPAVDIKLIPFINHTFDGTIRESNMIEDATSINFTVRGIYQNNLFVDVGYVNFFDGGHDNLLTDRDNVSLTVSYSF